MSTSENFKQSQLYTDHTVTVIDGKTLVKTGTAREWAAYIKAGYVVNSNLRPVRNGAASYGLTMVAAELGRYVAILRDQELEWDIDTDEYLEYVNRHADYFQSRRFRNR